jgi:hypothetical protein
MSFIAELVLGPLLTFLSNFGGSLGDCKDEEAMGTGLCETVLGLWHDGTDIFVCR